MFSNLSYILIFLFIALFFDYTSFDRSESSKKTLFKDLVRSLISIIAKISSLIGVILDDSNRLNRSVIINGLHILYNAILIEIFDVKVVYEINQKVYQGNTVFYKYEYILCSSLISFIIDLTNETTVLLR